MAKTDQDQRLKLSPNICDENSKKMTKNLNLDLILTRFAQKFFAGVLPLLDITHCCKLSLYAISRKTNKSNLRKWKKKKQFQARFWLIYSILRKLSNATDRREPLSVCLSLWCGKVQDKKHPSLSVSLRTKDQKNVLQTTIYIWNKQPNKTTLMSDQSTRNS